jgi:hypothetical protein
LSELQSSEGREDNVCAKFVVDGSVALFEPFSALFMMDLMVEFLRSKMMGRNLADEE